MGFAIDVVLAGGVVFAVYVVVVIVRRLKRRAGNRHKSPEIIKCGKCGYPLEKLGHPRCPECGALRGFKKSADDLGIRQEELNF